MLWLKSGERVWWEMKKYFNGWSVKKSLCFFILIHFSKTLQNINNLSKFLNNLFIFTPKMPLQLTFLQIIHFFFLFSTNRLFNRFAKNNTTFNHIEENVWIHYMECLLVSGRKFTKDKTMIHKNINLFYFGLLLENRRYYSNWQYLSNLVKIVLKNCHLLQLKFSIFFNVHLTNDRY